MIFLFYCKTYFTKYNISYGPNLLLLLISRFKNIYKIKKKIETKTIKKYNPKIFPSHAK